MEVAPVGEGAEEDEDEADEAEGGEQYEGRRHVTCLLFALLGHRAKDERTWHEYLREKGGGDISSYPSYPKGRYLNAFVSLIATVLNARVLLRCALP